MSKERNFVLDSVLGQAQPLVGLIEYAADSVVSKTLLDKPVGTITLFAFDQGQSLSEHTAPYHATVQVVDGKGVFTIGGKENQVKAGEVLIMPAHIPHSVYATERFKMLLIMIRA
jgi:quercetin dioxygenase-like cupin family protein